MNKELSWLIIFLRDFFLLLTIFLLHYFTEFRSKTVFLLTGMLIVWATWHLQEYLEWRKWRSQMS